MCCAHDDGEKIAAPVVTMDGKSLTVENLKQYIKLTTNSYTTSYEVINTMMPKMCSIHYNTHQNHNTADYSNCTKK